MSESNIPLGDRARAIGIDPRILSNWFYHGRLDRDRVIYHAGRTLIPEDYWEAVCLPELRRAGHLPRLPRTDAPRLPAIVR